jgi:hypothetical protein
VPCGHAACFGCDLPSIIAADAVFRTPVEWTTYPGRDLMCLLVRSGAGVFEDFKYHREFVGNLKKRAIELMLIGRA